MLKGNFPALGSKYLCAICDVFTRLGLELSQGVLRVWVGPGCGAVRAAQGASALTSETTGMLCRASCSFVPLPQPWVVKGKQ